VKKSFLFVLFVGIMAISASAQHSSTLDQAMNNPKGVADLFLCCPYVGIDAAKPDEGEANLNYGRLVFHGEGDLATEEQFQVKK
jgi:hypothetical protein